MFEMLVLPMNEISEKCKSKLRVKNHTFDKYTNIKFSSQMASDVKVSAWEQSNRYHNHSGM